MRVSDVFLLLFSWLLNVMQPAAKRNVLPCDFGHLTTERTIADRILYLVFNPTWLIADSMAGLKLVKEIHCSRGT